MIISLVVAASENNVIGKDNHLLWNLPNDLAFFKNTTWAMPVVMGRKTYQSLGKPLKGRTNIVISKDGALDHVKGIIHVTSLDSAVKAAEDTDAKECFVIGGGEIFRIAMPMAHRIFMTRVHATLDGDTFFPAIDPDQWNLVSSTTFEADAKHAYSYSFETWQRKKVDS